MRVRTCAQRKTSLVLENVLPEMKGAAVFFANFFCDFFAGVYKYI